jgi:hypothetical protein
MNTSNKPVILHYLICFALFCGGGKINAQERNKCILSAFKPTITGHINNAFIKSAGPPSNGKERVIFWKKDLPEFTLVASQGGTFLGGGGYQVGAQGEKIGLGETRIAIDGDTDWQFFGNLDYIDSTYTFIGTVRLLKHTFASSDSSPLVFQLIKDQGFVYRSGVGKVTPPDGTTINLGGTTTAKNETPTEKAGTSDGINLQCGDISYKLSVTGRGASGTSDYKDNDIAISFTAKSGTATSSSGAQVIQALLVCTISNVSPSTVVVHWGSDDKQYIVDSVPQVMQVLQLHYHPFTGGEIVELKTDMNIEPRRSEWVFVTALTLHNGIQQEILPSDPAEAERLKGKSVKLTLPLSIDGKETKRTVEFTVDAVVNTGKSASPVIAPTK